MPTQGGGRFFGDVEFPSRPIQAFVLFRPFSNLAGAGDAGRQQRVLPKRICLSPAPVEEDFIWFCWTSLDKMAK